MDSFPFSDPLKRNIYPSKEIKSLWLMRIFTSSLMKLKPFLYFPPAFSRTKGQGDKGFIHLFIFFSTPIAGNTAGFKVIEPCLRCCQHKAKLWAPGMQAVRLGWCHSHAQGQLGTWQCTPFWGQFFNHPKKQMQSRSRELQNGKKNQPKNQSWAG